MIYWLSVSLRMAIEVVFPALAVLNSPYWGWDYSKTETAVIGAAFHALEWLFVRIAPFVLLGTIVVACLIRKKALN